MVPLVRRAGAPRALVLGFLGATDSRGGDLGRAPLRYRDGLTRAQAERELRGLMAEARPQPPPGERLAVAAAWSRWREHPFSRDVRHNLGDASAR